MALGCEALHEVGPQALAVTYRFDAPSAGASRTVSVRFSGRRRLAPGESAGREDTFSLVEAVDVVPGSGPVALTARAENVRAGDWVVTAAPVGGHITGPGSARGAVATAPAAGRTTYGPLAAVLAPGAHLGAWPAFVTLGWVAALIAQWVIAAHLGLDTSALAVVSVLASVAGLVGAKAYYAVGHYVTGERRPLQLASGACIQGFVATAVAGLALGSGLAGLPLGRLLDASAPALLLGMAVGRYGCFFGGCCTGRPTGSRFGVWSSDRRVGTRRIPVQLLESAVALAIGVVAFLAVWIGQPAPAGAVFVGAVAAYTLGRQLLFPLRDRPRHTARGRAFVLAASALAVATDLAAVLWLR